MARFAMEFQCTICRWFNYPMLSDTANGNFTVKCGNCGHEHYRVLKDGVVTEDRHNSAVDHGDTIHVMPSACSEKRREEGSVLAFRRMEAAGLAT